MNLRFLPIFFVSVIGISSAVYLYNDTHKDEFQKAKKNFTDVAIERFYTVEKYAFDYLTIEQSIVGLYNSSNSISHSKFKTFVETISKTNSNFQAMSWIAVVPHSSLNSFERKIQKEGLNNFRITEKSSNGKTIPAIKKEFYYPVTYIVPYQGNEGASGFNLGSNPVRLAALEAARDTGMPVLSGKINLVQLKEDNAGVLLFMPVYKNEDQATTKEARRKNIIGFVSGVIRISNLLSQASQTHHNTADSKRSNIIIYLFDESDKDKHLLHAYYPETKNINNSELVKLDDIKTGIYYDYSILIGGRKWTFVAKPIDPLFKDSISEQKLIVFFLTLLFTFGLIAYLLQNIYRTKEIEKLVDERTNQLTITTETAKKNEEKIEAILNNTAESIITIDTVGTIKSANNVTEKIFGYTNNELINQNISLLIPYNAWIQHLKKLEDINSDKDTIDTHQETNGQHKDGHHFPMEISLSVLTTNIEKIYILTLRDITERKQAEIQKSEFISTISHELRTPLTSIKGSLGLVVGDALGDIPADAKNLITLAYNNCERQIRLVNDLLDMEKISSGKMEFNKVKLKLDDVIKESLEINKDYGLKFNITYNFAESISPAWVSADKDKIIQVLTNLLSNAAKFSPEGSVVSVTLLQEADMYCVKVIDQGAGIPEESHHKIFKRFSQVDSSDTRKAGGTGLGLFISKSIIEEHGGEINFTSEINKGATFYFSIHKAND